jgi:signal peptidase I
MIPAASNSENSRIEEHADVSPAEVAAAHRPPAPRHIIFPSLLEMVRSLLSIIVVAMFALTFILQPFRIPSKSMERTLLVGDFLLVNKMIYGKPGAMARLLPYRQVQRGDIVVFHFPLEPNEHVVKRVVGIPGDRIRMVNGAVYRNGHAVTEPYAVYEGSGVDSFRDQFPAGGYTSPSIDPHWWQRMHGAVQNGELIVPANSYFVLGDNRNHSRDSRYWGFVPRASIVGRPFVIYFSLRQSPTSGIPELPEPRGGESSSDKLTHEHPALAKVVDFARWGRMLHIVR